MSTSTAFTGRKNSGRCVVCGIQTAKRCPSCSAAGIDWMYFCSPEHQKEVWSTHKRVCGSNPFYWPLLTRDEINEMRSLFYVPGKGPFGVTTWEETCKMMLGERYKAYARGKSEKQIKDWVYCRFTNWLEGFVNKSSEHPREQQYWTVLARAFAFSIKLSSQSPLDGMITTGERHRLLYEDPFGFLAWIEVDKMPDMASWYDAPWWSTFQHRALLLVASLVAEYKNNEWNLAEKTWISSDHSKHAIMEAGFLSEEIISRTHLKEANMITDLINRMMEEIGLKKSCNHTRDCQGCGRVKPLFESSPY